MCFKSNNNRQNMSERHIYGVWSLLEEMTIIEEKIRGEFTYRLTPGKTKARGVLCSASNQSKQT